MGLPGDRAVADDLSELVDVVGRLEDPAHGRINEVVEVGPLVILPEEGMQRPITRRFGDRADDLASVVDGIGVTGGLVFGKNGADPIAVENSRVGPALSVAGITDSQAGVVEAEHCAGVHRYVQGGDDGSA